MTFRRPVPGHRGIRAVPCRTKYLDLEEGLYISPPCCRQSISESGAIRFFSLQKQLSIPVLLQLCNGCLELEALEPIVEAVKAFAGGRPCDGRGGGDCSLLRGDRRTARIEFMVYVLAVASLLSTDVLRAL